MVTLQYGENKAIALDKRSIRMRLVQFNHYNVSRVSDARLAVDGGQCFVPVM